MLVNSFCRHSAHIFGTAQFTKPRQRQSWFLPAK
jgi:hypothetical protein